MLIAFGKTLNEYSMIVPEFGAIQSNTTEAEYFLKSEHFDFETIKKTVYLDGKFIYLTEGGELYDKKGRVKIFHSEISDIKKSKSDAHFFLRDSNSHSDLYAWGWNTFGQVGTTNGAEVETPALLMRGLFNGEKILQIEGGFKHSVALSENRNIFVWGCNKKGKLGIGGDYIKDEKIHRPALLSNERLKKEKVIQLATGDNHILALTKKGNVYSWGINQLGQLGLGEQEIGEIKGPSLIDPKLFGDKIITQISCGINHSLVLTEDGEVYSWGFNEDGQLGVGDFLKRAEPSLVPLSKKVIKLLGDIWDYSVAQTDCGNIYVWGNGKTNKPELLNIRTN